MKSLLTTLSIFIVITIVASCTYSKREIAAPQPPPLVCDSTIHFNATINPILQTYCVGCHSPHGTESIYDYTSYAGIAAQASLIVQRITLPPNDVHHMPNDGTVLPDAAIEELSCWVQQNFPNN